jgi:hypothetical protein
VSWDPSSDLLFGFTDGLSDSLDTIDGENGEERVVREVVENRGRTPLEIVNTLFGLIADPRVNVPSDDRTALVLRS